jgi:hypothetical protein
MNVNTENPSEVFARSPEAALEQLFKLQSQHCPWEKDRVFISVSLLGVNGLHRYSGSEYLSRSDLTGRTYDIEFWDGKPAIHWTDVLHDPRTRSSVSLPEYVLNLLTPDLDVYDFVLTARNDLKNGNVEAAMRLLLVNNDTIRKHVQLTGADLPNIIKGYAVRYTDALRRTILENPNV